jgi:phage tail sheath protein FI
MSDDVSRLAKFLGMMGSAHDGEINNAARMAEKLRKSMNKSWSDLLNGSGGGSSAMYQTRAVIAEQRVAHLQKRVVELEAQIAAMRAARSSGSTGNAANAGKARLSAEVEEKLIEMLLDNWTASEDVRRITQWKTTNIRKALEGFAKRRGLKLRSERGYVYGNQYAFRFVRT